MADTRIKEQGPIGAFPQNQAFTLNFPTLALAASQPLSTPQVPLYLPTAVKIYRVIAGFDGAAVAGSCSINIVVGSTTVTGVQFASLPIPDTDQAEQPTAPNTQAYPPAYSANRQKLFLNNQALTMTTWTSTVLTPNDSAASGAFAPGTPGSEWDGIWGPAGTLLTLRTLTG